MNDIRTRNGFLLSSILLGVGVALRLLAQDLAWPRSYSFGGSRADTAWARMEDAYAEVALVLMCVGGLLLVITYARGLFARDPEGR